MYKVTVYTAEGEWASSSMDPMECTLEEAQTAGEWVASHLDDTRPEGAPHFCEVYDALHPGA